MSAPFQIAIGGSLDTTPSQVVTVFNQWELRRNLDDGTTLSFTCMGNSVAGVQIIELTTDVWIYQSSVLIERLRIVEVNHVWNADGYYELSVTCVDYRRLMKSRHLMTPLTFTGVNQGDIVWDVIQHTQAQVNGDLGITLGTNTTTVTRDREYLAGSNILDLIVDLSRADIGVAWEIDPQKQLNLSEQVSFGTNPQPVVMGTNALSMRKPSGAAQFANVALVSGDTQFTTLQIEPSAFLATDPRGRWERYSSFSQVNVQANLVEQAIGVLEQTVSPAIVYEFEIEPSKYFTDSNYSLGNFVFLVEPPTVVPSLADPTSTIETLSSVLVRTQILAQTITVDADGEVHVTFSAVLAP